MRARFQAAVRINVCSMASFLIVGVVIYFSWYWEKFTVVLDYFVALVVDVLKI